MESVKVFALPSGQQKFLEKLIESNMTVSTSAEEEKEEVFGEPIYTLSLSEIKKIILQARVDQEIPRMFHHELQALTQKAEKENPPSYLDVLPSGELNMFVTDEPDIIRRGGQGESDWPSVSWLHWFRARSGYGLTECRDKGILRRRLLEKRARDSGM